MKETETVKLFNAGQGYGFISREDDEDVFVHFSAVKASGYRSLEEGSKVTFVVNRGPKGLEATPISGGETSSKEADHANSRKNVLRKGRTNKTGSPKLPADKICENDVSPRLLAHAVDTFGSERSARSWLSSECGALNNQTPFDVFRTGDVAEVERILDCIDYGMLA